MESRDRHTLEEIRKDVRVIKERTDKLFELIESEVTPEDLEELGLKHSPFKFQLKKTFGELTGILLIGLVLGAAYTVATKVGWL